MSYFPFFFNLSHFRCLIIGGGEIALNKVRLLSAYSANITVVSLTIKTEIYERLSQNRQAQIFQRPFEKADLERADIIIIATDDDDFNSHVWSLAKQQNKIVNVVDDKDKCDFIFPGIVNRGDLTVAISTSGVAPTISSWLRNKLEAEIPQTWTNILKSLKKQQKTIRQVLPDTRHRRRFYRSLIDHILPYFLKPRQLSHTHTHSNTDHEEKLLNDINNHVSEHLHSYANPSAKEISPFKHAKVYLVGAGPGDPELLTLRALQVLQQADVVLYDRLLNHDLLDYSRRDATKIFVGKQAYNHSKTQMEINNLLIDYAQKGNIVVRLKGGDPFIFGRGGEEMHTLQKHRIDVEIVPGVSAINGIAANLGIPLTLRGISDKLLLTSVYATQSHPVNWHQLSLSRQTLAFYMGLQNLSDISTKLIKHGLSPDTPIALIEKGTFREQKNHFTTIAHTQSAHYIQQTGLKSPVMSIIGEVIKYRKTQDLKGKDFWINHQ